MNIMKEINEIFENILEINKSKNKIYKYKINKKISYIILGSILYAKLY